MKNRKTNKKAIGGKIPDEKYLCQSRWLFLSPLLFVIVWEIISRIVGNDLIFPSILSIFRAFTDIIKEKTFYL